MQSPGVSSRIVEPGEAQRRDQAEAGAHQGNETTLAQAAVGGFWDGSTAEEGDEVDALHRDTDHPHGGCVTQLVQQDNERNQKRLPPAPQVPEAEESKERENEPMV